MRHAVTSQSYIVCAVYIEGPPGVAKTMLAETMAQATSLQFFFYQVRSRNAPVNNILLL